MKPDETLAALAIIAPCEDMVSAYASALAIDNKKGE